MKKWKLNSWTKFPAKHLPVYQDKDELDLVLSKIKKWKPQIIYHLAAQSGGESAYDDPKFDYLKLKAS